MKKEFMIERQGKAFCLYAGILDLAHQKGLIGIETFLIQVPTPENGNVAIVSAKAMFQANGADRLSDYFYTGIGDASPKNVAPAMQTCLIRMAETRAKARALRDAVNIGVAAYEETSEEDATENAPEAGAPVARRQKAPTQGGTVSLVNAGPGQCSSCHAPEGKPHVKGCKKFQEAA
jgi:hypothetical protein